MAKFDLCGFHFLRARNLLLKGTVHLAGSVRSRNWWVFRGIPQQEYCPPELTVSPHIRERPDRHEHAALSGSGEC